MGRRQVSRTCRRASRIRKFQMADSRWNVAGELAAVKDVGAWCRKVPGSNPARGSIPECVLSTCQSRRSLPARWRVGWEFGL